MLGTLASFSTLLFHSQHLVLNLGYCSLIEVHVCMYVACVTLVFNEGNLVYINFYIYCFIVVLGRGTAAKNLQ